MALADILTDTMSRDGQYLNIYLITPFLEV